MSARLKGAAALVINRRGYFVSVRVRVVKLVDLEGSLTMANDGRAAIGSDDGKVGDVGAE